jgi:hypothetical protein
MTRQSLLSIFRQLRSGLAHLQTREELGGAEVFPFVFNFVSRISSAMQVFFVHPCWPGKGSLAAKAAWHLATRLTAATGLAFAAGRRFYG